jgi:hypothetical protein
MSETDVVEAFATFSSPALHVTSANEGLTPGRRVLAISCSGGGQRARPLQSGAVNQFEAPDPQFQRVVRDSFARQTLMSKIGAEMTRVTPGEVTIELQFS